MVMPPRQIAKVKLGLSNDAGHGGLSFDYEIGTSGDLYTVTLAIRAGFSFLRPAGDSPNLKETLVKEKPQVEEFLEKLAIEFGIFELNDLTAFTLLHPSFYKFRVQDSAGAEHCFEYVIEAGNHLDERYRELAAAFDRFFDRKRIEEKFRAASEIQTRPFEMQPPEKPWWKFWQTDAPPTADVLSPANPEYPAYCQAPAQKGLTCLDSDLILIRTLEDSKTDESISKEIIYQCRVCRGFYKYRYLGRDETGSFDGDGWHTMIDRYFKIEELYANAAELTVEEARTYGYAGVDFTWKNNRCNFAGTKTGLTCRAADLQRLTQFPPENVNSQPSTIHKCGRCGQLYKQIWAGKNSFKFYKPPSADFPPEEAKLYEHQA